MPETCHLEKLAVRAPFFHLEERSKCKLRSIARLSLSSVVGGLLKERPIGNLEFIIRTYSRGAFMEGVISRIYGKPSKTP